MKKELKYQVGQKINYSNGPYFSEGQIVKVKAKSLVVINSSAGMELWCAGHSVGREISFEQVK